jgi:pimeloyl-ACP methyl ester carboxylesterase
MSMSHTIVAAAVLALAWTQASAQTEDDAARDRRPVKEVAGMRLAVGAHGALPVELSADWSAPLPDISRAVIILHGYRRDADVYFQYAMRARAAAGEAGRTTLVIAPQFLAGIDIETFGLPPDTLRWTARGWEAGDPALGPEPVSSFDALDAILARLADRRLFPALKQVVVAGHSGGAQVAQRYAIAAKGDLSFTRAGIGVRYVVADPSSYAYFGSERPEPSIAAACQGYDRWKYGMENRPPYLAGAMRWKRPMSRGASSICWERATSIRITAHSTSPAWRKPKGRTGTRAVTPMRQQCGPGTTERRTTVSGMCRASDIRARGC